MAKRKYSWTGGYTAPTSSAWGGTLGAPVASTAVAPPPAPVQPAGIPDPYGLVPTATNAANATYGNTLAGIISNENLLANQYGLSATGHDANGLISGFAIDPNVDVNNPFSRAALLNRSFRQEKNRTLNGYAAAGQLYSGALKNAQTTNQFNFDQAQNDLINAALGALGGYNQQAASAYSTQQQAILDAQLQALQAALAQRG